jgi:hypothetical protein
LFWGLSCSLYDILVAFLAPSPFATTKNVSKYYEMRGRIAAMLDDSLIKDIFQALVSVLNILSFQMFS